MPSWANVPDLRASHREGFVEDVFYRCAGCVRMTWLKYQWVQDLRESSIHAWFCIVLVVFGVTSALGIWVCPNRGGGNSRVPCSTTYEGWTPVRGFELSYVWQERWAPYWAGILQSVANHALEEQQHYNNTDNSIGYLVEMANCQVISVFCDR